MCTLPDVCLGALDKKSKRRCGSGGTSLAVSTPNFCGYKHHIVPGFGIKFYNDPRGGCKIGGERGFSIKKIQE